MDFPTLYHKSKTGKVVEWQIWTQGDTIHTKWGQIGGSKQETAKKALGKNVGRSNETSPEQQAELEATSMHKHKLERKYSLSINETDETVFLPMLAKEFTKAKNIEYPVDHQPKLDGLRCLAYWVEDEDGTATIELLSRGGKTYQIDHLTEAISNFLAVGYILDGEIYCHGQSLQAINKLARGQHEDSELLEFWVYDGFLLGREGVPWSERLANHREIFQEAKSNSVKLVPTSKANSEEEVLSSMQEYLKEGFEGTIVRLADGKYELGYRSRSLLKLKPFYDAEYKVTGFYEGVGKFEGCATFVCETVEGQEFHACPKGTLSQKRDYFTNGESYIGKLLTVQYNNLTDDGIPQFPIGLGFRIDEDLPA